MGSKGTDRLVLFVRDPEWAHALWDLSPHRYRRIRIELRDESEKVVAADEIDPRQNRYYFRIPHPDHQYVAVLIGIDTKRRSAELLRSNVVDVPHRSRGEQQEPQFVDMGVQVAVLAAAEATERPPRLEQSEEPEEEEPSMEHFIPEMRKASLDPPAFGLFSLDFEPVEVFVDREAHHPTFGAPVDPPRFEEPPKQLCRCSKELMSSAECPHDRSAQPEQKAEHLRSMPPVLDLPSSHAMTPSAPSFDDAPIHASFRDRDLSR